MRTETILSQDTVDFKPANASGKAAPPPRRTSLGKKYGFYSVILLLVSVLVGLYYADRMFFVLKPGEVMVVYYTFFNGTRHNQVEREGFHIVAPWDSVYRYDVKKQTIRESMKALSRDGLEINLDAIIRFRAIPEMVPYIHREFGPNYVEKVVTPELEQSVQQVIGTFSAGELYSYQREASVYRILGKSKRLAATSYIDVDDVSLVNITLPAKMQAAIQSKLTEEQNALAFDYKILQEQKESRRKRIEVEGFKHYEDVEKLSPDLLSLKGIEATLELAKSPNSKVVIVGSKSNLPIILGNLSDSAK